MSHTTGPWAWFHTPHSSNQEYVVKVGRFHVASVDFVGNSVTEKHNAMLIAAAPELLAACVALVRSDDLQRAIDLARVAIAKAGAA